VRLETLEPSLESLGLLEGWLLLLLLLLLEELLLSHWAGSYRGWLPELLPWLLGKLLGLLGKGQSLLLRLLGEGQRLLLLLGKLLEVRRKRIDLAILVLIPGEAFQGNVLQCQLGSRDQGSWLRGLLELLLRGKLLLLLLGKLLLLRGKLLWSKLLLLLGKLLLLRSKLLLLLELRIEGWPLLLELLLLPGGELLLLLELLEILVEVLSVELVGGRSVRVEVGSIEDRSLLPPPLEPSPLGCEGSPLGSIVPLLGYPRLLLDHTGLVCEHCRMSLLLQDELRAGSGSHRGGA